MTKASLKNGYTRLANELLEQLACRAFTMTQYAVVLVVLRNTYGWAEKSLKTDGSIEYKSRKLYPYDAYQLEADTQIHHSNIRKAVMAMVGANVLVLKEKQVGLNVRFSEWKLLTRQATPRAEPPVSVSESHSRRELKSLTETKNPRVKVTHSVSESYSKNELELLTTRVEVTHLAALKPADTNGFEVPKDMIKDIKDNEKEKPALHVLTGDLAHACKELPVADAPGAAPGTNLVTFQSRSDRPSSLPVAPPPPSPKLASDEVDPPKLAGLLSTLRGLGGSKAFCLGLRSTETALLALLQREVKTGEQVVEFLDRWAASKREKGHDTAIKAVAGLDKIVREDWDKVMGGGKAPAPRTTAYDGRSSEYKASRAAYWAEQERREALWQPRTKEAIEAAKEVKDG